MSKFGKVARNIHRRLLILAALLLAATAASSREDATLPPTAPANTAADEQTAADSSHGELLYENHCTSCHTSVAHRRDNRRAKSATEVNGWVRRWANELNLDWSSGDIDDVTRHLVRRYYKFDSQSGKFSDEKSFAALPASGEIAGSIGCPE